MTITDMAVVVGVDGSPDALAAIDWACADAARRHRPLRIVHAYLSPVVYSPLAPGPVASYEQALRETAQDILAEATARARAIAPSLRITTEMPVQQAATALIFASQHADLVVVGNRGLGGFAGLLVGSVGVQLAAHAACPVVVVRPRVRTDGPEAGRVVVGVDDSHAAARALRVAFEQASFRGVGLTAVHSYGWPDETGPGDIPPPVHDEEGLRDVERRMLEESVTGWAEKYPDVDLRHRTVRGRAGAVLTELSAGAELLVVGTRGRGGFTGLLLGSVSQAAIHHAGCPIVIVR
jgi:nucleotide-binding universal stress UspA family protein